MNRKRFLIIILLIVIVAASVYFILSKRSTILHSEGYFLSSPVLDAVSQNSGLSRNYLAEHLEYKDLTCFERDSSGCTDGFIFYNASFGGYNGFYRAYFKKEEGPIVSRSLMSNPDRLVGQDVVQSLIEKCNQGKVYKSSDQYLFIDDTNGKFLLIYKGYPTDSKEEFYDTQIDLANGRLNIIYGREICGQYGTVQELIQ